MDSQETPVIAFSPQRPCDRNLIAQASVESMGLISCDLSFQPYEVDVFWQSLSLKVDAVLELDAVLQIFDSIHMRETKPGRWPSFFNGGFDADRTDTSGDSAGPGSRLGSSRCRR
jgi:hypothetical protein